MLAALERGGTIVTADPHQAYQLRLAWAERQRAAGHHSWPSPDILPLTAALSRAWNRALIDGDVGQPSLLRPNQERVLWEQIVREGGEQRFLQPHGTGRAAMRAWQRLREWDIDPAAVGDFPGEEAASFHAWAHQFQRRCRARQWIDAASATLTMPLPRLASAPWVFTGFDAPPASVRSLVERLQSQGVEAHLCAGPSVEARVARAAFADAQAEWRAAAHWARRCLMQNPQQRLLIVIPDLERERDRIERIFDEVLRPQALLNSPVAAVPFAIEGGIALARYPLTAAALTAIALVSEAQPFSAVSAWLRSAYLDGSGKGSGAHAANRVRLDVELRRTAAHELDLTALARALERAARRLAVEEPLVGAMAAFRSALTGRHAPAQWSAKVSSALRLLGWPGAGDRDSAEQQTLEKFNDTLAELALLDDIIGPVEAQGMLHQLRALAERTRFQPETGDAPLTLSARLADPTLALDGLWVSGLQAGAWPRAPRPDPFLPWELQRASGMPQATAEGMLALARQVTSRWATSASEVIFSWPQHVDDEEGLPSPLIADLPVHADAEALRSPASDYWRRIRDSACLEVIEDAQAPPLPPGAPLPGGARALTLQSLCAIRAFADRRLLAQPLEQPEPGIDARTRGTVTHHALALLWGDLESQEQLLVLDVGSRARLVESAVARAAALHLERSARWPVRLVALERERLAALLQEWLELELRRTPFRVVARETAVPATLAGHAIELRIDRIDRFADGRRLLLDYKTGAMTPAVWSGERPEDVQMPLYATVLEPPADGIAIAQVRRGNCSLAGVSSLPSMTRGSDDPDDWSGQLDSWRRTVGRLAHEFARGDARVDPKGPATCRTCHLHSFCRIDELMGGLIDEDDSDED